MATLYLPATPGFRQSSFGIRFNTQVFQSELNRSTDTDELPGAFWHGEFELPPMSPAQAAPWRAVMVKAKGRSGRIFGYDPDLRSPLGVGPQGNVIRVKGAAQTGVALITDGWPVSTTNVLMAGSYLQVTESGIERLHMVVDNASSDGSGDATLAIEPAIRTSPADNAVITLDNPVTEMMLVDDGQARWSGDLNRTTRGFSFSLIEVII